MGNFLALQYQNIFGMEAKIATQNHRNNRMSIIFSNISGDFDVAKIISVLSHASDSRNFKQDFKVLLDQRNIRKPAIREQIVTIASHMDKGAHVFGGSKWAVVVSEDASYGMMRMLSILVEDVPIKVDVFRDYDAAMQWLSA
jgi:hypothetical protein